MESGFSNPLGGWEGGGGQECPLSVIPPTRGAILPSFLSGIRFPLSGIPQTCVLGVLPDLVLNSAMVSARYISSLTHPRIEGFEWQGPQDDGDRKMFRDILEHGCQIIGIQPDLVVPDYSFSIGLYLNFLHPEILIMGVSMSACSRAINQLCREADEGGTLAAGDVRTDLFDEPRPVRFEPVPRERYFDYLGTAAWFYRSILWKVPPLAEHKFPVLQAIWPDPEGYYPDDPRCRPEVRKAQTLVELPDPT